MSLGAPHFYQAVLNLMNDLRNQNVKRTKLIKIRIKIKILFHLLIKENSNAGLRRGRFVYIQLDQIERSTTHKHKARSKETSQKSVQFLSIASPISNNNRHKHYSNKHVKAEERVESIDYQIHKSKRNL
jgi:hypothetical protein